MRLRHIEIFYHVYREGSISGAARTLHVSQPSVSKTLRHAEDQLGFALFDRVKGRLQPTPAADELFGEVCDIYGKMSSFDRTAKNIRGRSGGHIRLGALPSLGFAVAPKFIAQMRQANPQLSFDVNTIHTDDIAHALLERQFDLCLGFGCIEDDRITQMHIGDVPLIMLAQPGSWADSEGPVALAELSGRDFIGLSDSGPVAALAEARLEAAEITPAKVVTAHTHYVAASLVRLGIGCTIVDQFTAESRAGEGLVKRQFLEPMSVPFTAMHLAAEAHPDPLTQCLKAISTYYF